MASDLIKDFQFAWLQTNALAHVQIMPLLKERRFLHMCLGIALPALALSADANISILSRNMLLSRHVSGRGLSFVSPRYHRPALDLYSKAKVLNLPLEWSPS